MSEISIISINGFELDELERLADQLRNISKSPKEAILSKVPQDCIYLSHKMISCAMNRTTTDYRSGNELQIQVRKKNKDEIYREQQEYWISNLPISPYKPTIDFNKAILAIMNGRCPECNMNIKNFKTPSGFFGPEMRASLEESGINPYSGHLYTCSQSNLK